MAWSPLWFEMVVCIERRLTVACDQHECSELLLGQLGKSALPQKKAHQDKTKAVVIPKSLSEYHRRLFKYCQGPYIGIDIDFHQLWGKAVTLVGWFNTIGGQCTYGFCRIWNSYLMQFISNIHKLILTHFIYIISSFFYQPYIWHWSCVFVGSASFFRQLY